MIYTLYVACGISHVKHILKCMRWNSTASVSNTWPNESIAEDTGADMDVLRSDLLEITEALSSLRPSVGARLCLQHQHACKGGGAEEGERGLAMREGSSGGGVRTG